MLSQIDFGSPNWNYYSGVLFILHPVDPYSIASQGKK